ncbi:hypothetical protein Tco_1354493 [Tanacetum coccineum]
MQEEIYEFERLKVWELVPRPDRAIIISLKWIFKVKLDEYGRVLKNKACICCTQEYGSLSDGCEDDISKREFKGRDRYAHTFLDLENLNNLFLKFFNFNTLPLPEYEHAVLNLSLPEQDETISIFI